MAIDYAPEFGTKFTLVGPLPVGGGSIGVEPTASFNDLAASDDVGVLTGITGLDSPEVRDSGEDIVEFDGAVQGPNWYGARPIVLEGLVYGHVTTEQRAEKLARLMKASNAMREDARLVWTPSVEGGIPVYLNVRRNQPLRIEGGWNKTFQCSLVARDPRIYSEQSFAALNADPASPTEIINEGNSEAFPVYTLLGPMTGPISISNDLTGAQLVLNTDLTFTQALFIDTLRKTVYTGARLPGSRQNLYPNPLFLDGTQPWDPVNANVSLSVGTIPGSKPDTPWGTRNALVYDRADSTVENTLFSKYTLNGVAAGDNIRVGLSYISDVNPTSTDVRVTFTFQTSGGTVTGSSTVFSDSAERPISSAWRRFQCTSGPAPAATDKVIIGVDFPPFHGSSALDKYYVSGMVMEKYLSATNDGSFFDGDHPSTGQLGGWTGTPNASTSWSYTTQTDPMAALTPSYAFVDFASTVWAGLSPGENYVSVDWTPVAGQVGQSFRADWRHTWL